MAQPNVGDLVASTALRRMLPIADNVTNNNALLYMLNKGGRIRPVSGGRELTNPLSYDNNQSFKWYAGMETLDVAPYRVHDLATYQWKQAAVAVTVSGLEAEVINSGQDAIFDLVAERIEVAESTMSNGISAAVYSDGTGSNGKEIGGLQYLVSDTPAVGVVGGIDAATFTFWQNQFESGVTGTTDITSFMNSLWYSCTRNKDVPDLITFDDSLYGFYEGSLQDIKRIMDDRMADSGFQALRYKSASVLLDGGLNGSAPTGQGWFLNTKYLKYVPHQQRNMRPLQGNRYSVNQDASTTLIVFAGNLTMGNRSLQGRLST